MIRDLIRIYRLISDLIFLYHPISLDIRHQFHKRLNNPPTSRKMWEECNVTFCNYTLSSFIHSFTIGRYSKRFRSNIIKVLELEKQKMIDSPKLDLEKHKECHKMSFEFYSRGLDK